MVGRDCSEADAGGRVTCLKNAGESTTGTAFRGLGVSKNVIKVLQRDAYLKLTTVNELLKVDFLFLQDLQW